MPGPTTVPSSATQRVTRPWTKQEDDVLRKAVSAFNQTEAIDWHKVASHLPRRNNKECRKRWVYSLESKICKGSWDEEEDRNLRKGVAKYGLKWAAVAEVVGSRQPDQCSRRWHEVVNPRISHERWSLMEDEILKEAVETYGRKWTEIVERFFPTRTPISARNRYKQRFESRSSSISERHGSTSSNEEQQRKSALLWSIPDHSQNGTPVNYEQQQPFTPAGSVPAAGGKWLTESPVPESVSPQSTLHSDFGSVFGEPSSYVSARPMYHEHPHQRRRNMATSVDLGAMQDLDLMSEADTTSNFGSTHAFPSPITMAAPFGDAALSSTMEPPTNSQPAGFGFAVSQPGSAAQSMSSATLAPDLVFSHSAPQAYLPPPHMSHPPTPATAGVAYGHPDDARRYHQSQQHHHHAQMQMPQPGRQGRAMPSVQTMAC